MLAHEGFASEPFFGVLTCEQTSPWRTARQVMGVLVFVCRPANSVTGSCRML
jgi:hypothetical protein